MITRIGRVLLVQTALILCTLAVSADLAMAQNAAKMASAKARAAGAQAKANSQRFAADRIDISHAQPVQRQHSLIDRAAHGQAISDAPPAPLDGSPIGGSVGQVRQVGFLDQVVGGCDGSCGPVCDCAPGCGVESIGPSCGCELGACECGVEFVEPSCGCGLGGNCGCGVEVGCGVETIGPSCGCGLGGECGCGVEFIEPSCGCGIGAECGCGIEVIEPSCGCGIGGGCGCGLEIVEPGCGCDLAGDCGCGIGEIISGPSCGIDASCGCDSCLGGASSGFGVFLPYLKIDWFRLDLFAGVNGFTGPLNSASVDANNPNARASAGGSFGFYEGFNLGKNLDGLFGFDIATQFGLRATQTHLSGSDLTDEQRNQIFLTLGLFRRVDYGLQYGLAIDYLNEDWYYQADLTQLRGEISWNHNNCNVFGFQFMAGVSEEETTTTVQGVDGTLINSLIEIEPVDQYRGFFRHLFANGGDWEAFIGGTENSDTILGSLVNMPLSSRFAFNTGVTYIIPNEDEGSTFDDEAWNLSMGFTFRPGGSAGCGRYCRPMFNVADNGTFLVRER